MNIDEFIEYLQPTLQELEDTARLGYVEGITRIIMRGLKDLEENERPFHCSDLKRETMFVKNNNDIWEKEPDEKPQIMKVVKAISRKNFCNVNAWQKAHPDLEKITHTQFADTQRGEKSLIEQLGVFYAPAGAALRATFIVDPDNVIQHVTVNNLNVGRSPEETLRVLDALQTGELCACNRTIGGETL